MVIAFDGPDGVGKSKQLELTAEWLRSQDYDVHTARASGGTPMGEELRKVSLSAHERPAIVDVYISLAMHTLLGQDLRQRVAEGQICLVDRSPLAIITYNTYGSQLPDKSEGFRAARKMLDLWRIDRLFMLDAAQSVVDQRRRDRTDKPTDYFEQQDAAYHQRVRDGYQFALEFLEDNDSLVGEVIEVDATPGIDEVQAAIQAELQKVL